MPNYPQAVTIIMRSFNENWAIQESIDALFQQEYDGEIELIIIDSGSSDGSVQTIKDDGRAKLIEIPLGSYVPGSVLNLGADEATHDWILYLNADAEPLDAFWLNELLGPCLEDPMHRVSFSRQIPRANCRAIFAHDYERCFGPDRESINWEHFFSMVSCATHRSVLEAVPISEGLPYAEDDEWTRRIKREGYQVCYAEDSIVIHSHNYSLSESYKRFYGDSKAVAATGAGPSNKLSLIRYVFFGCLKDFIRDFKWCHRQGRLKEFFFAAMVRIAQRMGRRAGFNAGMKQYQHNHEDTCNF